MRCPKCGFISFDWLDNCLKCNTSFEGKEEMIGAFLPERGGVNWFNESSGQGQGDGEGTGACAMPQPVLETEAPASGPDIVLEEDAQEKDAIDIAEIELKRIAEDEEFQKALEEITV